MAANITVTYKKNTYTLEYNRNAVKQMEQRGFVLDQIGDKPMTMVPLLVYGAFAKHHKNLKPSQIDEIYKNITNKIGDDGEDGFIQALLELYADTVSTLTGNNEAVDEENAATWKVNKG